MKQFILLFALLFSINCVAQINYQKKTSYRFDKEDGWIRIIEASGFNIGANGDTTYWTEVLTDTQQEDPGIKPDSVPVLIPSSVFTIGTPTKDSVNQIPNHIYVLQDKPISNTITKNRIISEDILKTNTFNNSLYSKGVTKYKTSYKNKNRYRYIKPKKSTSPKASTLKPKKETYEDINIITYKKRLWMVVKANGEACIVEASTKTGAIKMTGKYISINPFYPSHIIR